MKIEQQADRPSRRREPLRGCLDRVGRQVIEGWAQNPDRPEMPVRLDIMVDGEVAAQALANQYRADLETNGLGSGRHAFSVRLPEPLSDAQRSGVVVRRAADLMPLARAAAPVRTARAA